MKFFLLLTFVTVSCALPFGPGKTINIGDDGTIAITGPSGKKVTISKAVGPTNDKFIDVSVETPNLPPKHIRIDQQGAEKTISVQNGPYSGGFNGVSWEDEWREKRSPKVTTKDGKEGKEKDTKKTKSEADILYSIFKEFEDVTDEKSYESILKKVDKYVADGQLDASVEDVLTFLHDQKVALQAPTTTTTVKPPVFHGDIASLIKNYIWTNKYTTAATPGDSEQTLDLQQGIPAYGQLVPQQQIVPQQQWVPKANWYPVQQPIVPQQQQFAEPKKSTYNPWVAYYLGQLWNQQRQVSTQRPINPTYGYPAQYQYPTSYGTNSYIL